jgi:WD40 repeat protein
MINSGTKDVHNNLADYFASKPLYLEGESFKKPNVRKLVEQPWQQTKGELWGKVERTLCDLLFIEVKCYSRMNYTLLQDYYMAIQGMEISKINHDRLSAVLEFVTMNNYRFIKWPNVVFQEAFNWEKEGFIAELVKERLNSNEWRLSNNPWFAKINRRETSKRAGRRLKIECNLGIYSCALTTDIKRGYLGLVNGNILEFDPLTGKKLRVFEGHKLKVRTIAISKDDKFLASGSEDRSIRIIDLRTGICSNVLIGHKGAIYSIVWGPENDILVSGSGDGTIRVWHIKEKMTFNVFHKHQSAVVSLKYLLDLESVLSIDTFGHFCSIDIKGEKQIACKSIMDGELNTYCMAVSEDGQLALIGGGDPNEVLDEEEVLAYYAIRIVNLTKGQKIGQLEGHESSVYAISVNEDFTQALSVSSDGSVRLWDLGSRKCITKQNNHGLGIFGLAVNWVKNIAITGGLDGMAVESDTFLGEGIDVDDSVRHKDMCSSVVISPRGDFAWSSGKDGRIFKWDLTSGECIAKAKIQSEKQERTPAVLSMNLDFPMSMLILGDDDGWIHFLDCIDMKRWLYPPVQVNYYANKRDSLHQIIALVSAPKYSVMACNGPGNSVFMMCFKNGKLDMNFLRGHKKNVICLLLHPSNQYLYSADDSGCIICWKIETHECLWEKQKHSKRVYKLEISNDGQYLRSLSEDGTMGFWDSLTGRLDLNIKQNERKYDFQFIPKNAQFSVRIEGPLPLHLLLINQKGLVETIYGDGILINQIDHSSGLLVAGGFDGSIHILQIMCGLNPVRIVN